MAVVVQSPPEAGSKLRGRMRIIGYDQMFIANPQTAHQLSKTRRRSNLRFHRLVRVNNIAAPIDINSARNMLLLVVFRRSYVMRFLETFPMLALTLNGANISAHIHNAHKWIV